MSLRRAAERWLTGTTLADKLAPVEAWDEEALPVPGLRPPDAPGRPPGLGFSPARVPFPAEAHLDRPEARGVALHFFANHELLAIELMALALLRFPAPEAFRRGLARVVAEEQRHLQGYLARLEGTGVRFGDVPVNGFFWNTLAPVDDPARFLAGLALTFEQANLDYAAHFAAAFRRVGDEATARALDVVLADEIGHVRHGRTWFERWRPGRRPFWEEWVDALPAPLTPARARGPRFEVEARLRAGLDREVVERLAVYAASKGRPPRVHTFEPDIEAEHAGGGDRAARDRVRGDLGTLTGFLAGEDDAVLVARRPSPAFLAGLAAAGFVLPEWVEGDDAGALAGRTVGSWEVWGASPSVAARFPVRWDPAWRALADKAWAAALADEGTVVAQDLGAVERAAAALVAAGQVPVVKAPFATAGRGRIDPADARAVTAALAAAGHVLVEPWRDRVLDLSVQLDVAADGTVRTHPPGRFLADGRGRYRGAVLGRWTDGLPPDLRRWLHGDGAAPDRVAAALDATARQVGRAMAGLGYAGPAGVDAFVYRVGEGYALRRLVEVNPRRTMGRVARALERRVARGAVGLWVFLGRAELRRAGFAGFPALAARLAERAPVRTRGTPPVVEAGALWTTDPSAARDLAALLVVGPDLGAARAVLAEVGLPVHAVGLPPPRAALTPPRAAPPPGAP